MQLQLVRWRHEHHPREPSQVGDVQEAVMDRPVLAHEPGAVNRKDHGKLLKRDLLVDLVEGALEEGRINGHDRTEAGLG